MSTGNRCHVRKDAKVIMNVSPHLIVKVGVSELHNVRVGAIEVLAASSAAAAA